ncbi:hypothetical protein Tco_1406782, partial [Tanacetum coccineum]
EGDNSRKDTTSSEIYETVRSKVRRAIADIQDDLQDAIRRNTSAALVSTEVTDASKLVKPGAVGLVLGIRREYAKELEESQERARKLRSDLVIEEHRKNSQGNSSVAVTDEAMSYFDECVSISAFDSSDFSAAEDPSVNSLTTTPIRGATSSGPNCCIGQQMIHDNLGSSSVVASSFNELLMDRVLEITNSTESERKTHFSFDQLKVKDLSPSSSTQENKIRVDEVKKALGPLLDKAKEVFSPISSWDFEEVEEAFGPISDDTKQAFGPVSSSMLHQRPLDSLDPNKYEQFHVLFSLPEPHRS